MRNRKNSLEKSIPEIQNEWQGKLVKIKNELNEMEEWEVTGSRTNNGNVELLVIRPERTGTRMASKWVPLNDIKEQQNN